MEQVQKMTLGDTIKVYGKQLFSFIRGRTKTNEDAEDILQEVWYQLSRLTNVDDLESISAWLYTVSRNKITDLYRRKKDRHLEDFTFESDDGSIEIKDILLADDNEHPELTQFKEIFWQSLFEALDALPPKQRSVFIRNEIEDMTLQQIADADAENIKTIISRKGYAVKHIRQRLEPLYREFFN
ncbi:MAG: sigma-70 family RNA polymerase sigma factor [Saprospiraceae bacterium]